MENLNWVPEGVDVTQPNVARVYDYSLGGSHNFKADRDAVERVLATMPPNAAKFAWINRAWLQRAVRYCLAEGVTQFLDLGSGLPTKGNVHETAQEVDPSARVVHVEVDEVAFAHCQKMLEGDANAGAVHADLRDVDQVLGDPVTTSLLDFGQPVALLMSAVLHFIPDSDDPGGIIRRYAERLVSGSYLVLSHGTTDDSQWRDGGDMYRRIVANVVSRTRTELESFFTDFELVHPGVVWVEEWPLEPGAVILDPPIRINYVGIGRKP